MLPNKRGECDSCNLTKVLFLPYRTHTPTYNTQKKIQEVSQKLTAASSANVASRHALSRMTCGIFCGPSLRGQKKRVSRILINTPSTRSCTETQLKATKRISHTKYIIWKNKSKHVCVDKHTCIKQNTNVPWVSHPFMQWNLTQNLRRMNQHRAMTLCRTTLIVKIHKTWHTTHSSTYKSLFHHAFLGYFQKCLQRRHRIQNLIHRTFIILVNIEKRCDNNINH